MILDTSFLIDVLRGNEKVTEWEKKLDERELGVVTSITVMELWEGIHLTEASDSERERVEELLEGLT
jgi:tRNA(fMet)-specific endonuclease VapC